MKLSKLFDEAIDLMLVILAAEIGLIAMAFFETDNMIESYLILFLVSLVSGVLFFKLRYRYFYDKQNNNKRT